MNNIESKRLLQDLFKALKSGDQAAINKLKYENLFYGSSLFDVVFNYIFLTANGITFDFGSHVLLKGTRLYRIRRYVEDVDFDDPKQWSYPPTMPVNRANRVGVPTLYLGTTETVCVLETHINTGEKYVLGEYEVNEDIALGGFWKCEDFQKISWYLAGVILNAFLISPSRSDKNRDLFAYLDQKYSGFSLNDLQMDEATAFDLPLKFAVLNKSERFYDVTNRLADCLKGNYPEGIGYSSCYLPVATVGIMCSDYNIALYEPALSKIRFLKSSVKEKTSDISGIELIKIITGDRQG
ncbi:MAG: RES family NAD+ phosphorylase [Bacilli bacterium]|nr:RES family NAD+ phosphorylase [Bacilli bacterium]